MEPGREKRMDRRSNLLKAFQGNDRDDQSLKPNPALKPPGFYTLLQHDGLEGPIKLPSCADRLPAWEPLP